MFTEKEGWNGGLNPHEAELLEKVSILVEEKLGPSKGVEFDNLLLKIIDKYSYKV